MKPSSLFEITRRNPGINASATFASAAVRGLGVGAHATDPAAFDLAQHNTFIGHLTRRVTVGGLTVTDRVFGVTSDVPVGVEAPFVAGQEVSAEKALEIEVEGSDYMVTSGTGAITGSTAVGTSASYCNGKLRATQTGELVNYVLTANNLTPSETGNLRCRFEAK